MHVLAHTVCNGISIMVNLINIITRPINLPNGCDPLIAGVETSIFEAIKALFGNGEQIGERSVLGGWYCLFLASGRDRRLIQNSLLLLIRSYYNTSGCGACQRAKT